MDKSMVACFFDSQCIMASTRSTSLNGSPGSMGRASGEAQSFLYIFIQKKLLKVKDLGENLPPCLSRAAMASPKFWSWGAAALTAHSWIHHCYGRTDGHR